MDKSVDEKLFKIIVCGDDTMLRAPMGVNEELLMSIVNRSGMKMDTLIGTGTPFWSQGDVKGAHLLRRHFNRDYSLHWDEEYIYKRLCNHETSKWTIVNSFEQVCDYLIHVSPHSKQYTILRGYVT